MKPSQLSDFVDVIGQEKSGWQEISVQIAADIASDFSEVDWKDLMELASTMPSYWQERCAEALGASESLQGIPTLMLLLNSASLQVAAIAASQLDNLSVTVPLSAKERLVEILAYLELQQSPRKIEVERLINKIH